MNNTFYDLIVTDLTEYISDNSLNLGAWIVSEKYSNNRLIGYHWNDRLKLYKDYQHTKQIYKKYLNIVTDYLNEYHDLNEDVNYWNLIVGFWLWTYIQISFDRWECIKVAISEFNIKRAVILNYCEDDLIKNDSKDYFNNLTLDYYNNGLFSRILKDMGIQTCTETQHNLENAKIKVSNSFYRKNILFLIKYLTKFNKLTLSQSYLGRQREIIFSLMNISFPFSYYEVDTIKSNSKYERVISRHKVDNFNDYLGKYLFHDIPSVFMEDYQINMEYAKKIFPNNSKYILTSNSYHTNDLFKIWCAGQKKDGAKLFIGQHGGNFGTALFNTSEEYQIDVSTKYLTWGWESNNPKVEKFNIIKNININYNNGKDKILLITMEMPRISYYLYSSVLNEQWELYFNDQIKFINKLNPLLQKKLIIRLKERKDGWSSKARFLNASNSYMFDEQNYFKSIKESNIVVCTYNAATFLETMSSNIPTVMFWNPNHWELRIEAQSYWNDLELVKIFHRDPTSAAAHINNIYNNIDDWWNSNTVLAVRKDFCDRYCRKDSNYLETLNKIMKTA